ncbi:uncharacterized protein YkwD [Sphingomonas vulcanisoli]|uniref:Uncharacterized protein YkwD n=1 Tax=Sphingomonas vulcanisoli TaxID=1658060 RepID=A0ABX0TQS1_9SPHN|nr:CAP domain-containing protein [Sphingomonas vulcanisoli]NIJ07873.1 uncharacterized protein YkwD [Sphingomonas vulcanisoli]
MRGPLFVAFLFGGLALTGVASATPPQHFPSDLRQVEATVLATFNFARTQPTAYVETLVAYRGFFHANAVIIPGQRVAMQTTEGRPAVDETIAFLQAQSGLGMLQPSETLRRAAADYVTEQSHSGDTGHFGADGSSPGDRVARQGGGDQVAEVIAYGAQDAKDVIRQLLIDDGVPDRGHRIAMFSAHLRYAGVACGPHPQYGTMCVIDMADTPDATLPDEPRRAVAAMGQGAQH